MNTYTTLYDVLTALGMDPEAEGEKNTRDRGLLMGFLRAVSRQIETKFIHRRFWTARETRYFSTGADTSRLPLHDADILAVHAMTTDSEGDWTWDGETWVDGDDFWLWPYDSNRYPKTEVRPLPNATGNYTLPRSRERYVKIDGTFGYGDGASASPWRALAADDGTALTVTFANAATKTGTVSASSMARAGHTLLVEGEQLFVEWPVSPRTTTGLICRRGVNGTTAAAHTSKALAIATYPEELSLLTQVLAVGSWNRRDRTGFQSLDVEGFRTEFLTSERLVMKRLCEHLVKKIVA